MSPTRKSTSSLSSISSPLLDHLDGFRVGYDIVLAEQFEASLRQRHHLPLLQEIAVTPAAGVHLDEEPPSPWSADGTGGKSLCRPEVEPAHERVPIVLTARTMGMPPADSSSTVTDDGATAIRWKRSRGWPR